MARVIVILALLFVITAGIFALTRKPAVPGGGHATIALPDAAGPATGTSGTTGVSAQDAVSAPLAGAAPAFASVGMDRRGRASFTGTASPGDRVSVVEGDKVLGRATADQKGSWTIEFRVREVPSERVFHVRARRDGQTVEGPQRAILSPPSTQGGLPHLSLAGLEAPPVTPAPAAGIVIETTTIDGKGRAELAGRADGGGTISVQLDGREAGAVEVGGDGRWSLSVTNGGTSNVTSARILLTDARGQEVDSVVVPLDLPSTAVATLPAAPPAAGAGAGDAPQVARVRRGDSLWKIARRQYGDGRQWTRIYAANRKRIRNPDLILPGWQLRLP